MEDSKSGADSRSWAYQLRRWWREHPEGRRPATGLAILLLVAMIGGAIALLGAGSESGDTIAMPTSSSDLEGEDYNDVMTRLEAAGFAEIETTAIADLVTGWLTKDGEVDQVSVNGETEFEVGSRFPKDAKIVITYHTFPEQAPEETEESSPEGSETPESSVQEADDTVLTPENSEELRAVLTTRDPAGPEVVQFVKKYSGRTIEFDGYTWDWAPVEGYDTIYHTLVYIGDANNAGVYEGGPTFRVKRYQWPNFSPMLNRMNVHVIAKVDGWDEDLTFIDIDPQSIEAR